MNQIICPQESNLLVVLAGGAMSEELNAHLEQCAACQETKLVWTYLQDCAAESLVGEIASAESVWWRAQIAKKRAEASRSIAAIDTMQKIAVAVAAALLAAIAAWQAPKLLEMSHLLMASSAAVLMLLFLSLAVMLRLNRPTQRLRHEQAARN